MATYEIEKFMLNGNEFILPDSGSGGVDEATAKAITNLTIGNYDEVFRGTKSGLYEILNGIDSEDSCGLTEGDTWNDIITSQTSMNLISHSWGVMSAIVSSSYAVNTSIANSTARTEYVASWISMMTIANSEPAMEEVAENSDMITAIVGSATAMDAISNSTTAIEVLLKSSSITSSQYTSLFGNSTFASKVYNNNELLTLASKNTNALVGLKSSSYWSSIKSNLSKMNIVMENNGEWVIANETSANLRADTPLRSIIQNNLLDSYIDKNEEASNSVIVFDIDSSTSTTFNVSRYGYNAATSTWLYSVDGGAWTSTSVAASTTPLSVNLGSTGKHTIVIKPSSYAVGWARQMGNRTSTNYWTNTGLTFKVRNLPIYAFTSSTTTTQTYCLAYAFYGCTSLTEINIKTPSTFTSVANYYLYYTFYGCTGLTTVSGTLNVDGVKTIGNYYLGYTFRGCSALTKLPAGWNMGTITTTVGTYLMYYAFYQCTALTGLPTGYKLPTVGNSSYYMRYTWSGCTNLTSDSPAENLTFINAASNCFSSSGISTASPSAGSSIAVHRV